MAEVAASAEGLAVKARRGSVLACALVAAMAAGCETAGRPAVMEEPHAMAPLPTIAELWDFEDPAASETRFRDALERAPAADITYRAELLTQVARAQGLQRRFDEAHETLDGVPPLLAGSEPRAEVRYLLERGRAWNSSGAPERAMDPFRRAMQLAEEAGLEALAIDAVHMLGIAAPAEEQLDWNLRALRMAEAAEDERARGWRGPLYNNIGWTYHDRGDYETAQEYFQKSLVYRRELGKEPGLRIARWTVARGLRSLGRLEEALAEQRAIREEYGEVSGYVEEEIGECLLALGRSEESRPAFRRAYEMLSDDPWLSANEPDRLARLQRLGE